jgi:BTB/POZ domain
MCVHTQPDHTRLLGSFSICCPWEFQKSEWGRCTDSELLGILILSQAESALSVVQERQDPQFRINPTTSPLEPSDVSDANLVIRSSDFVNFKVHKPVLAAASPFFKDLLSLHQPPDSESVDGLPVVQLSEDSELLSTLVSMLYHLRPVIPNSYDKVLSLLTTRQW